VLAGLATGLSLRDSAAQNPAGSQGDVVSVPTDQAELATPDPVTELGPGVPTATEATETAVDSTTALKTVLAPAPDGKQKPTTVRPAVVTGNAVGNAALSRLSDKRREARKSCAAHPEQTSRLFGVGSTVPGRPHRSLTWLFLAIAIGAAVVAAVAIAIRRRDHPDTESRTPKTGLEIASSTVANIGTLATLSVAYLGTGVKDRPPPHARMTVREVHPRITYGAYRDVLRGRTSTAPHLTAAQIVEASGGVLDRIEIGNVAWLELRFTGYHDTAVTLQWASFREDPPSTLIPGSVQQRRISIAGDSETRSVFRPIWIGSPRVKRYHVEFRLLDHGQLRQIASTGPMKGIPYRYAAC
jgi:hypothetical protein